MRIQKTLPVFIGVIVILVLLFSMFSVTEGESALILRLGQIVGSSNSEKPSLYGPGLHFKIPLIDKVKTFDMRIQELVTLPTHPLTVVTKEQTYLVVEYFARWRINNLAKFYTSTGGSVSWAETLLEQRLNDIVRAQYGKRTSSQAISLDRAGLVSAIRSEAVQIGKDQGISIIDVRIQQITLPKDVMDSVFKRMATERKQFAEAKRAEGIQKGEEIRALADQRVTVIKAEAFNKGAQIRARGDFDAAQIYSKAYGSNPQFYAFYRSMLGYQSAFSQKSDVIVLKPEGQFFNYFKNSGSGNSNKK